MSLYDPLPMNTPFVWNKSALEKTNQKNEIFEIADDIFKFGLVCLTSAIGSFDILDLF